MNYSIRLAKSQKWLFAFLLLISIFLFSSCQTSEKVLTFALEDDVQQYYIRSTKIKDKHFLADIDFTIRVKNGALYDPINVNYSIKELPNGVEDLKNVTVGFCVHDTVYSVMNKKIIMKNVDPIKFRYTSELAPEDFLELVHNSDDIKIQFMFGDYIIESIKPEINETIANFNIILDD
ncbi:MAG: hypothetical protein BKP49_10180 [Treponema sp. CETP13]|nr:MAG: hypothetical protein BKP49_10180 [Treponema sp. CETP13]